MNIRNKPSNKSTVRIAMIGCGAIAECYHLPALKQHAATRDSIVLVDPNQSRTAQLAGQFNIAHCSADYRALTDDIDGVIVATPAGTHFEIANYFLQRGIHVLCEKPLTEDYQQAKTLVESAEQNNAYLAVNQTRRFFPSYGKIRELILQGTFGKLQSVHYHDGIEFDWPAASPNHFRPDVRGTWSDTGVHLLDTIVYWLGGESMELVSSLNDAAGGPEALATVQLRKDNCDIEIKVSRLGRLMNSFRIVGTEATLESDAEGWSDLTLNHRNGRTQRINCTGKQKYAKYTDFAHPLIDNFVECIRGTATPVVSGRSVLPVIQLLEEAYEKAQRYPMPWDAHWESCYV